MSRISSDEIEKLSADERLELIGELWDSLQPEQVPITPQQRQELDRRIALYEKDPDAGEAWESVRDALLEK